MLNPDMTLPRILTYQGIPVWRHVQIIQWVAQIASAILVVALVMWFFGNMAFAIEDREIPFGFSFLSREYQTPIGEHVLPYESSDSFLYALIVAATNTVVVAVARRHTCHTARYFHRRVSSLNQLDRLQACHGLY